MTVLRRLLFALSGGAFLGGVLVTPWVMYLKSQSSSYDEACSCANLAPHLLADMARWQGFGAATGAVLALGVAIVFSIRNRKRKPPKSALPEETQAPASPAEQEAEAVAVRPPPM